MSTKLTYTQTATHSNDFSLNRSTFNRMGNVTTKKSTYKDSSQRTSLLKIKEIGSVNKTLYSKNDKNEVNFHLSKTRNIGYISPPKTNI
jgi:hypothetical protein